MGKLNGLIAAAFAPFQCGQVDLQAVPPYMEYLVAHGISGVFVNGTTGESHSLTLDERIRLAESWLDAAPLYLRLLDHAIKGDTEEARLLQVLAVKMISRCMRASMRGLPAIRTLTEWRMGTDLGVMRAPITPLPERIVADLQRDVEEIAGPHLSISAASRDTVGVADYFSEEKP